MQLPFSYDDILNVNEHNFNEIALEIFRFQANNNQCYADYLKYINVSPISVTNCEDIPYLPISFFKTHTVLSKASSKDKLHYFESSSTTGMGTSKHFYEDIRWYVKAFNKAFQQFYGDISSSHVIALLPNYMTNKHSSLLYMVDDLIKQSATKSTGYYLDNHDDLIDQLKRNEENGIPTILFGVSYALLDAHTDITFNHLTIIETGGMKGRRKEITRNELHDVIKRNFKGAKIHSEYGMTELFSQAYLQADTLFKTPNWMKVSIRQLDDPFSGEIYNKNGLIHVADLANIESCSFIATSDIGKMYKDGRFEVLGRFDHSEQRGCNLLIT